MNAHDRWLLPAGIIEVLPQEAAQLEKLRRQLLDLYTTWGYELVIPPLVEYLETLLAGTGPTLDLQTFKLIDQLTGRLLGVRADMTPQVARIDAHHLKRDVPTRLCYLATVLHTRPNHFAGSRSPLQTGVELYGYAGVAGDAEILSLMLATLQTTGLTDFHVDVGHVGIYQSLVRAARLQPTQETQLLEAIKRKASAEIHALLTDWQVPNEIRQWLSELVHLYGDYGILAEATRVLAKAPAAVHAALSDLHSLSEQLSEFTLHFDLAELRGYNYHTGIVFAAYVAGQGQAIAKGGRYDNLSQLFGRQRPATGFSTNLRMLVSLLPAPHQQSLNTAILAPAQADAALLATIAKLRQQGHIVIRQLPNQIGDAQALGCNRELRLQDGTWQIVAL